MTVGYRAQGARRVAFCVRLRRTAVQSRRTAVRQLFSAYPLAIVSTVLLGACSPAQNGTLDGADVPGAVVSADARVTMERQPCFGTCPVYKVDVDAAGVVTFRGERFVETTGTAVDSIGAETAAELVREMVAGGFFQFAERYTHGEAACGSYHTDAPRVILTLRTGGRTRTVEHDYGCSDVPPELRVMQERVDEVAGVAQWVGRQ